MFKSHYPLFLDGNINKEHYSYNGVQEDALSLFNAQEFFPEEHIVFLDHGEEPLGKSNSNENQGDNHIEDKNPPKEESFFRENQKEGNLGAFQVTSLNRLYRPQFFRDVIGQNQAVSFLSRAFLQNKMPQSLLFSGSYGLGKTTLARLTAKILCCLNPQGSEPCNICPSCNCFHPEKPILHSDVVEWDGASYTSVDDVRPMIETCAYGPMMSRSKIFIIDEVHMLSRNAFNALLKIIEEPPHHVYFLFATTQREKIPTTILSRCHDVFLRPVGSSLLETYLLKIYKDQTHKDLPQDVAHSLSIHAQGSVRDAIKLLEHHLLFPQEMPNLEELWKSILKKDEEDVWRGIDSLLEGGLPPEKIIEEFILLAYKTQEDQVYNNKNEKSAKNITKDIKKERRNLDMIQGDVLWQILHLAHRQIQKSPFPQLALKMLLGRLLYIQDLQPFFQEIPPSLNLQEKNHDDFSEKRNTERTWASQKTDFSEEQNLSSMPLKERVEKASKNSKTNEPNRALAGDTFPSGAPNNKEFSLSKKNSEPPPPPQEKTKILSSTTPPNNTLLSKNSQNSSDSFGFNNSQKSSGPFSHQNDISQVVFDPKCFPDNPHIMKDLMTLAERKKQGMLYAHLYQNLGFVEKKEQGNKGQWVFSWNAENIELPEDLEERLETLLQEYEGKTWTVTILEDKKGKTLQEEEEEEKRCLYDMLLKRPNLQVLQKHFPKIRLISIDFLNNIN